MTETAHVTAPRYCPAQKGAATVPAEAGRREPSVNKGGNTGMNLVLFRTGFFV